MTFQVTLATLLTRSLVFLFFVLFKQLSPFSPLLVLLKFPSLIILSFFSLPLSFSSSFFLIEFECLLR